MNFGLCCIFKEEQIKFKTFTLKRLDEVGSDLIDKTYRHNISELQKAIDYCEKNNINSYRVSSDLLPSFGLLFRNGKISNQQLNNYLELLQKIDSKNLRLSFHPSQFVNINSPHPEVVKNSELELRDHIILANALNIKEINFHIGGSYGNKQESLERFITNLKNIFSEDEIKLFTIENDELNYSVEDVLYVSKMTGLRVVYDIHHERCHRIGEKFDELDLFLKVRETWKNWNYQRIHISSPRDGYSTRAKSRPHSDFIDINHLPNWLIEFDNLHIDIEAKAKELAIAELQKIYKNLENI